MFSVEQLQAFITMVETASFSAAARSLNKVQSVVSQHAINLEIDCTGRYPTLTEAGEKLLPHAQAVIEQHQRLKIRL